jgi:hypothetical protein
MLANLVQQRSQLAEEILNYLAEVVRKRPFYLPIFLMICSLMGTNTRVSMKFVRSCRW